MSSIFIHDDKNSLAYDALLIEINTSDFCIPKYTSESLTALQINLIKALAHDVDVVLIDSDLSGNELNSLAINEVNQKQYTGKGNFDNFQSLAANILNSKSVISIFTSGTTGQPKQVSHNVRSLAKFVQTSEEYAKNIWGFAYNPTHIAGLQVFFQAFLNQNPIINLFANNKDDILNLIGEFGITHLSATPTFFRLLLPYTKEFNSVKRITFGGEKSDHKLHNKILKIFPNAKVNNIYASTEAGTLLLAKGESFQIPDYLKDKVRFKENELIIHKSLLAQSVSIKLEDDFYHTGDLIEWIDSDNSSFRFASRQNEMINVGGYKVNPGEIEDVILENPEIENAIVFGQKNSVLGNILCSNIKLTVGSNLSEAELRQFLAQKLQGFKIPRFIKFLDELNITRTGKIKRQ